MAVIGRNGKVGAGGEQRLCGNRGHYNSHENRMHACHQIVVGEDLELELGRWVVQWLTTILSSYNDDEHEGKQWNDGFTGDGEHREDRHYLLGCCRFPIRSVWIADLHFPSSLSIWDVFYDKVQFLNFESTRKHRTVEPCGADPSELKKTTKVSQALSCLSKY